MDAVHTHVAPPPNKYLDLVPETGLRLTPRHYAYLKISEATTVFEVKRPISYVTRVVRNLAIDRYRRSAFESMLFAKEEEGDNAFYASDSPEVMAIDRQALALIG